MNGSDWAGLVTQIATLGAVLFAGLQVVGARAAKHRDFENLYVQRYWNLMDRFDGNPWSVPSVDDLVDSDKSLVTAYLQLCEDELDLRRNGYISTKTWGIWVDGMKSQCARPAYEGALGAMKPAELPALRNFLGNGNADPLKMNWFLKWWTGIGIVGRKPAVNWPLTTANEDRQLSRS